MSATKKIAEGIIGETSSPDNAVTNQTDNLDAILARDSGWIEEHARLIKIMGRRVISDIVEIGSRLTLCREKIGHGLWHLWLEREFGWSIRTADNFINISELSKSAKFADLNLPLSGLYLLAAPKTPVSARQEVIAKAREGKTPSVAEIGETIREHKKKKKSRRHVTEPSACDVDWKNMTFEDFGNPTAGYEAQARHYRIEATNLAEGYPLLAPGVDTKAVTTKEIEAAQKVADAWSKVVATLKQLAQDQEQKASGGSCPNKGLQDNPVEAGAVASSVGADAPVALAESIAIPDDLSIPDFLRRSAAK